MANKRMFSKAIINTDEFLELSNTAKALYFLLGMEADDEGFVAAKRVMKLYDFKMVELKQLVDLELVKIFDGGVVVILDWHENNYLDKNRIKPTKYQNEVSKLVLTSSGKYVFNNSLTRVEESSIEESSIEYSSMRLDEIFTADERKELIDIYGLECVKTAIDEYRLKGKAKTKQGIKSGILSFIEHKL